MGRSGQKIVSSVRLDDIRVVLSSSYATLTENIMYANINMWAKYKPVRLNSPTNISQQNADGTWKSNSTWWRGDNGNCGLVFNWDAYRVGTGRGVCTDDNALPNALNRLAADIDGGNNGWSYERPYGGTFCPFRLLDFCEYNHAAPNPIRRVNVTEEIRSKYNEQWTQQVAYLTPSPIDITQRDYIMPTDISSLSLQAGFAIYKRESGSYKVMAWTTGYTWVGYGGVSESGADGIIVWPQESKCEAKFKHNGTYYVLPLLFSRSMSQPERKMSLNNVGVYLVPIPNISFYSFKTYFTGTTLIAKPMLSTRQVGNLWRYNTDILFDATEDDYSGGTFSGVEAAIVNSNWSEGDSFDDTTKCAWHKEDGSFNVPNNQTVTWTRTGNVWLYDQTWRVLVRTKQDGGQWSAWTVFTLLQPAPSE